MPATAPYPYHASPFNSGELEWCKFCRVDVHLYPTRFRNICMPCLIKYESRNSRLYKWENCPRCGRCGWTFHCVWCGEQVCEHCVNMEHSEDDCYPPDD